MRQTSLAKVGGWLHKAGPLSDAVVVVGGGGEQGVAVSRGGCHLVVFIIGGGYTVDGRKRSKEKIRRREKEKRKKKKGRERSQSGKD